MHKVSRVDESPGGHGDILDQIAVERELKLQLVGLREDLESKFNFFSIWKKQKE